MKPTRHKHSQRGTQLVEFALVLPLIILIFFIVTEGASLVRTHQVLNNAAREGGRLSIQNRDIGNSVAINSIKSAVALYATNNGVPINNTNVAINQSVMVDMGGGKFMETSVVTVTYQMPVTYLPALTLGKITSPVTLTGTAQFRNMYN